MPYVQFESVGDFIPKPRCSKFAVGFVGDLILGYPMR